MVAAIGALLAGAARWAVITSASRSAPHQRRLVGNNRYAIENSMHVISLAYDVQARGYRSGRSVVSAARRAIRRELGPALAGQLRVVWEPHGVLHIQPNMRKSAWFRKERRRRIRYLIERGVLAPRTPTNKTPHLAWFK